MCLNVGVCNVFSHNGLAYLPMHLQVHMQLNLMSVFIELIYKTSDLGELILLFKKMTLWVQRQPVKTTAFLILLKLSYFSNLITIKFCPKDFHFHCIFIYILLISLALNLTFSSFILKWYMWCYSIVFVFMKFYALETCFYDTFKYFLYPLLWILLLLNVILVAILCAIKSIPSQNRYLQQWHIPS